MKNNFKYFILIVLISSNLFSAILDISKSEGISEYVVEELKKLGYTKEDGDKWISYQETRHYSNYDNGYAIIEWNEKGVQDIEDIILWTKLGVYYNNYPKLQAIGISKADQYKEWQTIDDCHMPRLIKEWIDLGIKEPKVAKQWLKIVDGYNNIHSVERWIQVVNNLKNARKWKNAGFNQLKYIKWYIKRGITNPLDAKKWRELELYDNDLKTLLKNKISINEYKNWKNNNIKVNDIIKWKKAGFNKLEEALIWINAGVTNAKFIKMLKDIGINNVEEYEPFSHINTISQMKLLKDLGYKRRDTLMEQLSKFDSMSGQVHGTWISYKNLFFKDQNTLLNRIKTLDKYSCTTLEEDYFSISDPYYNKGNCYIAGLSLFQRLGKDYGLAKGINGEVIFVSFDKPIKKGQAIHGVIMGLGHYKYTNSYGSTKIISKGHIILQQ